MPEIDSVRLTADLINTLEYLPFNKLEQNPQTKNKTKLVLPYPDFSITAYSRGKEFKINFRDLKSQNKISTIFTFGLSGYWTIHSINDYPDDPHWRIKISSNQHVILFRDPMRFSKWRYGNWSENRGPDPLDEYPEFVENIKNNLNRRIFNKPICEMLMDQKYFNGIGNYLRAMLLSLLNDNPFLPANEYINKQPLLLKLCRNIPICAYISYGGKGFTNPFPKIQPSIEFFEKWKKESYKSDKFLYVKDKNNRTFWFHPKWKNECLQTYGKINS